MSGIAQALSGTEQRPVNPNRSIDSRTSQLPGLQQRKHQSHMAFVGACQSESQGVNLRCLEEFGTSKPPILHWTLFMTDRAMFGLVQQVHIYQK